MRAHLKEMLDIRVIRLSSSPWASAVMLVRKKGGKLCFCINLRKLNQMIIKDTYSIPHIQETLDCLKGAVWFTSLDLKSGYWQVKMSKESKAIIAFTVGPLRFYKCEHMPFRLTNMPAMLQCLMEMCLRELQLTCSIIYLDDIVVFAETPWEYLQWLRAIFLMLREEGLNVNFSTWRLSIWATLSPGKG